MDFSNLWNHCYRFTHVSFHTVACNNVAYAYGYQQCHCLAALPAKMSAFSSHMHRISDKNKRIAHQQNPYPYNKNPDSLCYEQKHMSVLIWIETIFEYWFNHSSSSKFSSAVQTNCLRHSDDFFAAQDVFHNAGNIFRWWNLSIIVGVRLWFKPGIFVQSWTATGSKIPQKV